MLLNWRSRARWSVWAAPLEGALSWWCMRLSELARRRWRADCKWSKAEQNVSERFFVFHGCDEV